MAADIRLGKDPVVTAIAEHIELIPENERGGDRRFKALTHGDDRTLVVNADSDFRAVRIPGTLETSSIELAYPGRQPGAKIQASGLVAGQQVEASRRFLLRGAAGRFEAEVDDERVDVTVGGPRRTEGSTRPGLDGHVTVWSDSGVDRVELDGEHGMVHATKLVRADKGTFSNLLLQEGEELSSLRVVDGSLTVAPTLTVGGRDATLPQGSRTLSPDPRVPGGRIVARNTPMRPLLVGTDGAIEVRSRLHGTTVRLDGATGTVEAKDIDLGELGSLVELLQQIKSHLGI